MTLRERYKFTLIMHRESFLRGTFRLSARIYFRPIFDWYRWVVQVVGACSVGVVIVVALVVGAVAVVVGLDVDRGYGLGFVVGAYTYP